jgi:hypothetical protein
VTDARDLIEPAALVEIDQSSDRLPTEREVHQSVAISLRRLADALERLASGEDPPEAPEWWQVLKMPSPDWRGKPWPARTVEAHYLTVSKNATPEALEAMKAARDQGLKEAEA